METVSGMSSSTYDVHHVSIIEPKGFSPSYQGILGNHIIILKVLPSHHHRGINRLKRVVYCFYHHT